jgi:hypothetical protein
MTRTKLTWRELKALNPSAFEKHMENVLDYIDDSGDLTIEKSADGRLFIDGFYPGDEYGGECLTEWTGAEWEETVDDEDE